MRTVIELARQCQRFNVQWVIENPEKSLCWMTSQLQELSEMRNVYNMTFDFCAFGTKWRKRTAVLADHVDSADVWAVDTMRCRGHKWCSFTGEKHMQLVGYDFFINARVQTEAEFIRQNGPADSQFCFWDPPSRQRTCYDLGMQRER